MLLNIYLFLLIAACGPLSVSILLDPQGVGELLLGISLFAITVSSGIALLKFNVVNPAFSRAEEGMKRMLASRSGREFFMEQLDSASPEELSKAGLTPEDRGIIRGMVNGEALASPKSPKGGRMIFDPEKGEIKFCGE